MSPVGAPLLAVKDLRVEFPTEDGIVHAVDGISYAVEAGRTLGIVGESGSGKTVSSLTTIGLTRTQGAQIAGEIRFEGSDLVAASDDVLRGIRGNDIAMIFQDPLSALHPFYRVGAQLVEAIRAHQDVSKAAARARTVELLELVGMPDPSAPHRRLPARVLGRHAPAGDDRDGTRQRAKAADRRRADDRPRRHRAGADPRPPGPTPARAGDGDHHHHPRPRRRRGGRGSDRRDVRGPDRRVARRRRRSSVAPEHPYTWGLLRSIPSLERDRGEDLIPVAGRPPSLIHRPSGCHFHPRCPYAQPDHARIDPQLTQVPGRPGHAVACLLAAKARHAIWGELRKGRDADTAAESAGLETSAVESDAEPLPTLAADTEALAAVETKPVPPTAVESAPDADRTSPPEELKP